MNSFISNKPQYDIEANHQAHPNLNTTSNVENQAANISFGPAPKSTLGAEANFETSLMREMLYFDRF